MRINMKLFYTTTTGYNGVQTNSSRSLGGFKSATPVVNDDFSNLFGNISVLSIKNGRDEYRALVLKNEFAEAVNDVKLAVFTPEDAVCSYKVAVAPMNYSDKYGNRAMENVMAPNNKPFNAQFIDAVNGGEIHIADTIEGGGEIGIWICRHIDKEKAKEQYENVCEPDPTDRTGRRYKAVEKNTVESVDFSFSWE